MGYWKKKKKLFSLPTQEYGMSNDSPVASIISECIALLKKMPCDNLLPLPTPSSWEHSSLECHNSTICCIPCVSLHVPRLPLDLSILEFLGGLSLIVIHLLPLICHPLLGIHGSPQNVSRRLLSRSPG